MRPSLAPIQAWPAEYRTPPFAAGLWVDIEIGQERAASLGQAANVLIGPRDGLLSAESLAEAGVRRISVGGALARAAYGEMLRVAGLLRGGNLPAAMSGIVAHDTIQILMRPKS